MTLFDIWGSRAVACVRACMWVSVYLCVCARLCVCTVYVGVCEYVRVSREDATKCAGVKRLRFVGSLNLHVSFAKEPFKRDYILQKRPMILRSLLSVATA